MEGFTKLPKMQCFKEGGNVTNVYEAKKSSGDKNNIRKVKDIAPAKAAAPSKAAAKPNFKGSDVAKEKSKLSGDAVALVKSKQSGKSADSTSAAKKSKNTVRKFQYGGSTGPLSLDQAVRLNRQNNATRYLGPAQQAQLAAQQQMATRQYGAQPQQGKMSGQGAISDFERAALQRAMSAPSPAPAAVDTMGGVTGMPMQKRGGKVKKAC